MKRREFLTSAASVAACVSLPARAYAESPCPPPTFSGSQIACGDGGGNLAEAAESLSPGQAIQFVKNTLQNPWDIQWQLQTIFYDPVRGEIQYMGKPASGQSREYSHYLFSEENEWWTAVARPESTGIGHIWSCAFDESTGDYYYGIYSFNRLRRFRRASGVSAASWGDTATAESTGFRLSEGNLAAAPLGWHPNLFGPGQGGIYTQSAFRAFAYNPRSDTWSVISSSFPGGTPFRDRSNGQCVYLPGSDRLVVFCKENGNSGGEPALWIEAGAGNSSDMIGDGLASATSEPPIRVSGLGGNNNHGHVVVHPQDANRMLLLDEHGSSRVWESSDSAETWQLQGYSHPFQSMNNSSRGEYTVGTIGRYGVIIGMTSDSEGGETVLWKPGP